MPTLSTRILAGLSTVAAVAALASCGTSTTEERAASSSAPAAPAAPADDAATSAHDAADVMFAQMMIPHHEQAVELSGLVSGRSENADVIALATKIAAAQQPEIDTMKRLLSEWGEPTTMQHGGMDHGGMDHGGMNGGGMMGGMMGMVDTATVDKLGTLRGAEFDKLWLQSMIGHHEGAIAMAKPEVADGKSSVLVDMAKSIISSQQVEIDQMKTMLASMGG